MNKIKTKLIQQIERNIKDIERAREILEDVLFMSRNGNGSRSEENNTEAGISILIYRKEQDPCSIGAPGLLQNCQSEIMEYVVPKIREGLDNLQTDMEKAKDALETQHVAKE